MSCSIKLLPGVWNKSYSTEAKATRERVHTRQRWVSRGYEEEDVKRCRYWGEMGKENLALACRVAQVNSASLHLEPFAVAVTRVAGRAGTRRGAFSNSGDSGSLPPRTDPRSCVGRQWPSASDWPRPCAFVSWPGSH